MEVLNNAFVKGAITGLLAAAAVDIAAFKKWQSFDEAVSYNWKLALWRWFQGALVGMMTTAGLGTIE